jgi:phospholipid/cholesterol/gamma-HCH transport system substrate-binding protein
MRKHETAPVKVGIFVFAGVFLAMVVIFLLGSEKQIFKRQYILLSTFTDISGLRVGAQVQLAGLSVGTVDRISFPKELNDKRVEVRLAVNQEFQDRIRQDSVATISTQGLLGDKYVSVSLGTPPNEVLKDGDTLKTDEKAGFEAVMGKANKVMEKLDASMASVDNILKELETGDGLLHSLIYETDERPLGRDFAAMAAELKDTSRELRQITAKINRGEGTVGAFLQDPSLYYDIRRLFARVERNKILTHVIRSRVRDLELEKVDSPKAP